MKQVDSDHDYIVLSIIISSSSIVIITGSISVLSQYCMGKLKALNSAVVDTK